MYRCIGVPVEKMKYTHFHAVALPFATFACSLFRQRNISIGTDVLSLTQGHFRALGRPVLFWCQGGPGLVFGSQICCRLEKFGTLILISAGENRPGTRMDNPQG